MSTRMLMSVTSMTCQSCARHVTSEIVAQPEDDPATDTRTPCGDYDLAIVGSGSASFAAAIRASDLGARVVMVEQSTVGGTCVNEGCVPSKALIRAGEIRHLAAQHGLSHGPVDLRALVGEKDELVAAMRQDKYVDLLPEYGIDLIHGDARFSGPNTLTVEGRIIDAAKVVVATGAAPAVPPIAGLAESGFLTSTGALDLTTVPESLAVIGANAIGLELGQFFVNVGSRVAFFDVADRIAPLEEPEISAALTDVLRSQGADVHASAKITRIERDGGKRVIVTTVGGEQLRVTVDQILLATGRTPNTTNLGVLEAGIEMDDHAAVIVDENMRTSNPNVFAAGDVTTAQQFVYVAAQQGALAAENALEDTGRSIDLTAVPRIIFTSPQVAAAGLTEKQARDIGHSVKTSALPLTAVPRALVNHDTRGLVKIVAEEDTDRVLGVHMLADGAGDVIQAAIYAIKFGLTTTDLADTWAPYLTMAEGLKLAAQTFTRDVAKLSCCAA